MMKYDESSVGIIWSKEEPIGSELEFLQQKYEASWYYSQCELERLVYPNDLFRAGRIDLLHRMSALDGNSSIEDSYEFLRICELCDEQKLRAFHAPLPMFFRGVDLWKKSGVHSGSLNDARNKLITVLSENNAVYFKLPGSAFRQDRVALEWRLFLKVRKLEIKELGEIESKFLRVVFLHAMQWRYDHRKELKAKRTPKYDF